MTERDDDMDTEDFWADTDEPEWWIVDVLFFVMVVLGVAAIVWMMWAPSVGAG